MLSLSAVAVIGKELGVITVTVVVMLIIHVSPKEFTVEIFTVYVVVVNGLATGFAIFGLLKLPDGDQLYANPPVAFNDTLSPSQIIAFGLIVVPPELSKLKDVVSAQPFIVVAISVTT